MHFRLSLLTSILCIAATALADGFEWNTTKGFGPWGSDMPVASGSRAEGQAMLGGSDFLLRCVTHTKVRRGADADFSVVLIPDSGLHYRLRFRDVRASDDPLWGGSDSTEVSMSRGDSTLWRRAYKGRDVSTDAFSLIMLQRHDSVLRLTSRKGTEYPDTHCPEAISRMAFEAPASTRLELHGLIANIPYTPLPCMAADSVAALTGRSDDPAVGYYHTYSATFESSLAASGGEYTVALVPAGDGGYDMVYLSGAVYNAAKWRPGYLKARLRPGAFEHTYNVTWYDGNGRPVGDGVKATVSDGASVVFVFPYQSAAMTFRRVREPERSTSRSRVSEGL